MTALLERLVIGAIFLVGFWALVYRRNIVKKIFGLALINSAVVLLFILEGSRIGVNTPILEEGIANVAEPVPQAFMLTAIVIGVCLTAFSLALTYRLYSMTGSLNIEDIRKKVHDEHP